MSIPPPSPILIVHLKNILGHSNSKCPCNHVLLCSCANIHMPPHMYAPCPCSLTPPPLPQMACHHTAHAMPATSLGVSPTIATFCTCHITQLSTFVPLLSLRVCFGRESLACGPYLLGNSFVVYVEMEENCDAMT